MLPSAFGEPGAALSILCLGAHCDDIEIGCGGSVLRLLAERPGSTVYWVALASTPEREKEARASAAAFLARARQAEIVIERFRDGYLPFEGIQIKDLFEATKALVKPDLIFTHHREDRHQDHRMVAEMTWNTFRNHLVLEYEIPKYEGDLGRPNLFVPLTSAVVEQKVALLTEHFTSQLAKRWFRRENFEAVMRLRGIECNAPDGLAEAFHAPKLVV